MKKLFLIALFTINVLLSYGQNGGEVKSSVSMKSAILGDEIKYSVYLPFGYESGDESYQILYLLHGYTGDETDWVVQGKVDEIANRLIAESTISPTVIVMPDGKDDWYINDYSGKIRWADMFIEEFIPFIEDEYRVKKDRRYRSIAGLSMGGQGALNFALKNTNLFSNCIALSAAVYTDDEVINRTVKSQEEYFGYVYGRDLIGKERLNDTYLAFAPLHLIEKLSAEELNNVNWYIDCGDDDFLYKGNSTLHMKMRDLQIEHEYRVRDGGHTWDYWITGIEDGLLFIEQNLKGL